MTDPGFAGSAGAMNDIRSQNNWFQQQISAGQLSFEPEAAEESAKAHEEAAAEVAVLITQADKLDRVQGLGDYPSAVQLARKFGLKAKNGSTGAADLLAQCRDELNRKADLFRQAAKNYRVTDEQAADDFRRGLEQ